MKKSVLSFCLLLSAVCVRADVPVVDISGDISRQSIIAEGSAERYEGHPTTLLSDDGKTLFAVWTTGHGGPCGQMARSDDGGRTWKRLDAILPEAYRRTHKNCPVLQKAKAPDGHTRYLIFSAKTKEGKGMGILASDDLGKTWYESPCQSQLSSFMPPTGFMRLKDGSYALFGQVRKNASVKTDRPTDDQSVWMSLSRDGGLTWGEMRVVASAESRNLCEPCCLRSPDGSTLVLLIRENRHVGRSMMAFSKDEGATWSKPVDTPWALTGDRHEGVMLPDGRYVIAFRDQALNSPTRGQFMAWIGTWANLAEDRPGAYRIHLLRHYPRGGGWSAFDTGYPGVELLNDGTIVCTTYSRHFNDERQSSVVSTRFRIEETDAMLAGSAKSSGNYVWGGRKAHLAVVNPPCPVNDGSVISLRGTWEFTTMPMHAPWRNGIWKKRYQGVWPNARKIQVPGAFEPQGVGESGMSNSWDCKWDHNAKYIRHKYEGDVLYRKSVLIPSSWKNRRVWLKVGGVKSCGYFWVNDKQVAFVNNSCGTYKYDVTDLVAPGATSIVTVAVNNAVPSRKGLMSGCHRWGGIYRDVELEASPVVFIDDAWARGDVDRETAEVHVTTDGLSAEVPAAKRFLRVSVEGQSAEKTCDANGETVVTLPLKNFRAWSPEAPNLYTARVEMVENGRVVQTRFERFGVRKLEVRGKEFYLNNRPYYFRGFGDDAVYPITGVSPADHAFHRAHLAKAHAAGFNFTRLHTHVELPEYFDAADECGIIIQAEQPYYSDVPTESFEFDPLRDVTELNRNFRRHASFGVYSMGNEGSYGPVLDKRIHGYVKAMDRDRLKINQDCHEAYINPPESSDYLGGPIKEWPRGSFNPDRPFVTHEYLNLCIKLDSRLESRFNAAWLPPVTRKGRREWLARFGLNEEWGDRLQDSQHALQRYGQKLGIESARADPYCDGHCFWTLVDVVVEQGGTYTAQGLFNPFWETKRGGYTEREFARFNSPRCVLADLKPASRIAAVGETIGADVVFANYGDGALVNVPVKWRLSAKGADLAKGELKSVDAPLGPARKIGEISFAAPQVSEPMKVTLEISVGETDNAWDMWIFPKGLSLAQIEAKAKAKGVVIASSNSAEAKAARENGAKLITIDGEKGKANHSLGWWWMDKQVGTAIKAHPALGAFPHEGWLSPLWHRILKDTGLSLSQNGVADGDLIIVGEGGKDCFRYLAERAEGRARVLAVNGLAVRTDTPEANYLLNAFVDYLVR